MKKSVQWGNVGTGGAPCPCLLDRLHGSLRTDLPGRTPGIPAGSTSAQGRAPPQLRTGPAAGRPGMGVAFAGASDLRGIAVELASAPVTPTFRADHPFLFLFRDRETGTTLFLGRIGRPEAPGT